jgi:putative nucleotidyltransferase with HDIG domain
MIHDRPPERILIVDDDAAVRSVVLRQLERTDRQCISSHNAFDALNKLKRSQIDLIVSDIMMPGMSGVELLRFAKKQDPDIAVIMLTGSMNFTTALDSLRLGASDFITKPFDVFAITRAVDRALEHRRLRVQNRSYRQQLEVKVRERTLELNEALHDIEESYKITLEALVTALDAREHETQAHSMRVRAYTMRLAHELGLSGDELIEVGRGALLHDVGKIGVPDSILLKPGRLTEEEWVLMREHPKIGHEILKSIRFLVPAAEIVLSHQEQWNGKGYPYGLAGADIPLGARIFAVVDTMDAMTSDRPYRKALSFQEALAEILRCSGTQFAPPVVDAFLSISRETWETIHDSVNRMHENADSGDVLCRI